MKKRRADRHDKRPGRWRAMEEGRQGHWLVKGFTLSTCYAFCPRETQPLWCFNTPCEWEHTSHNALCSCVPQSHCMSGVHLLCIKVSGKDATGVSHSACSSLKGDHQKRARGVQRRGWWLHILLRRLLWWHSWLAQHTRVPVKASSKQTTPINLVPLDASLREASRAPAASQKSPVCLRGSRFSPCYCCDLENRRGAK